MSDREARIALLKAIHAFQRADTEYRRAQSTAEQPRLSRAGTRYMSTKLALFRAFEEANRP